ncbi:MAG TPA: hypothetical protein VJO15_03390 [Dehalococcoidia bacterium]|nr:hypothetical protein [Dehalococcoidia bacterium]
MEPQSPYRGGDGANSIPLVGPRPPVAKMRSERPQALRRTLVSLTMLDKRYNQDLREHPRPGLWTSLLRSAASHCNPSIEKLATFP